MLHARALHDARCVICGAVKVYDCWCLQVCSNQNHPDTYGCRAAEQSVKAVVTQRVVRSVGGGKQADLS